MIRVIAIDDEPLALQQLTAYIRRVPFFHLAGECQSAFEAIELMEHNNVDAIFCDISMPDLSGMDFVRQLAAPPLIVFTTAYSEYAIEGYKVNAVDYLLKPFGFNDFQRAALKVKEQFELRNGGHALSQVSAAPPTMPQPATGPATTGATDDTLFIKTDYRMVRISISDIRYIEGMSEYLKLHLDGEAKPIITLLAMKKIEERLPPNFMRIHRSYIVNLNKVVEVNKNRVILDKETFLPIGENYKEQFNEFLTSRFLGK